MARLFLVHLNEQEAETHAAELRRLGHEVEVRGGPYRPGWLKEIDKIQPEAVVISLDRLPSHGRSIAAVIGERKVTRTTPIVFAGGEPEKVAQTKEKFPECIYAGWERIRAGIQQALRQKVQPHPKRGIETHGPLVKRLGIKEDSRVVTFNAPASFERTLGMPVEEEGAGPAGRVILFCESESDLARDFARAAQCVGEAGGLWIAWPKRASGVRTDITSNAIREYALARGWVDYKVCSIDAKWSGYLLARRR